MRQHAVLKPAMLESSQPKPANLGNLLRAYKATTFGGSPSQINWIKNDSCLRKLNSIFISGDYISEKLCFDLSKGVEDECVIYNCLGFSEIGGRCFIKPWKKNCVTNSIGVPINGISIEEFDTSSDQAQQFSVSAIFLAETYLESSVQIKGKGTYSPGDYLRIRAGEFYFAGRDRDFFKISGKYFSGAEIAEKVISAVDQVTFVFYAKFFNKGGEQTTVLLYAGISPNKSTEDLIKRVIKTNFGKAVIPQVMIHTNTKPMSESGKIDRKAAIAFVETELDLRYVALSP